MTERPHIHLLSDAVINKIAAGEVVDRPASVVKELIENALDAGARHVDISITAAGREAIVVKDDGYGMDRDDALLAIERHATSKIADVGDIERIDTFGFRGEALAAIAAVSRLTLRTCPQGADHGVEISVVGGRIQDVTDTGGPPGTSVAVRHLFFNVPARRKFLRADATELSHIRQVFLLYAIANPGVAMRLWADDREVCRAPASSTREERQRDLFPNLPLDLLRRIRADYDDVRVEGWVSLPQLSRGDRSEQYLFVNRRPVVSSQIGFALNEVYHTLLPRGRYPVVFLFIEVPPDQVDVNVHPTKKEVRFRNGGRIRDVLIEVVRDALVVPHELSTSGRPSPPPADGSSAELPGSQVVSADLALLPGLPTPRAFVYPRRSLSPFPASIGSERAAPSEHPREDDEIPKAPWAWCRILGQVGGLYIVLETEDGLVLMDPHAAHERILYEQFMRAVLTGPAPSQGLLSPETVKAPAPMAAAIRNNLEVLSKMGFGIAEFGADTFIIDAVPAAFGSIPAQELLLEAARSVEEGGQRGGTERWSVERVARAACRAAVKAQDQLALEEIERLVVDLAATEMPYTCPHGRPTLIHIGYGELNRKFGRA